MTQEDKELLLKDLCARLPYGVILNAPLWDEQDCKGKLTGIADDGSMTLDLPADCIFCPEDVKPYLRPMSSMTQEERLELSMLTNDEFKFYLYTNEPIIMCSGNDYNYINDLSILDWLNAHHFDYRRLIKKGLALEAPEGMYNIKIEEE